VQVAVRAAKPNVGQVRELVAQLASQQVSVDSQVLGEVSPDRQLVKLQVLVHGRGDHYGVVAAEVCQRVLGAQTEFRLLSPDFRDLGGEIHARV